MASRQGAGASAFHPAAGAVIIPEMDDQGHKEREHFFGQAKVMAGLTLVSRVLGLLRDMAINSLGATHLTSGFQLAFTVPNLFRQIFGEGALTSGFVPVLTETEARDGADTARRLLANCMALLAVFLAVLMLLIGLGLAAWCLLSPGALHEKAMPLLTTVMLPFMVTVSVLALGGAGLNCKGHFAYPAFAPVLLNLFMIASAWFVAPRLDEGVQLYAVAASVPLAGVVQLAGLLWMLRRFGYTARWRLRPIEPGVRTILKLIAPLMIGLGFIQLMELFNNAIAYALEVVQGQTSLTVFGWELARPLREGALVRINAARRLYQFPMGVLAISLGVAVLPLLSRYANRGDASNLRDSLNRALRLAFLEGLVTGAGLFLLAEPILRLLFELRKFTRGDAVEAAHVLRFYAAGLWAICSYQIVARTFYALKDVITPLKISCGVVFLNQLLVVVLVWVPGLGPGAFGLATSIAAGINTVVLLAILRRRIGRIGGRKLLASIARAVAATAAMCAAILALRWWLGDVRSAVTVGVCIPAGAAVFLAVLRLLRAPELGELFGAMRKAK